MLLLADQVAAAVRPHFRRMHGAGGHIHALAGFVRARLAVLRERHFAFEDDVRGLAGMAVVGIERARNVPPKKCVAKAFRL